MFYQAINKQSWQISQRMYQSDLIKKSSHPSSYNLNNSKQIEQPITKSQKQKFWQNSHIEICSLEDELASINIILFYPRQLPILKQEHFQQTICLAYNAQKLKQIIKKYIIQRKRSLKFNNFDIKLWAINNPQFSAKLFYDYVEKVISIQRGRHKHYVRTNGLRIQEKKQLKNYYIRGNLTVIAEVIQNFSQICLFNDGQLFSGKCANCGQFKQLRFICQQCNNQFYCSLRCYKQMKTFHSKYCQGYPIDNKNQDATKQKQIDQKKNSQTLTNNDQKIDKNTLNTGNFNRQQQSTQKLSISKRLDGLLNLGNTCYMNACLQCLFHTAGFMEFFINNNHKQAAQTSTEKYKILFIVSLGNLIKQMATSKKYVDPTQFKKCLDRLFPQFSGYNQHDAFSFILNMLNFLLQFFNQIKVKKPYQKIFEKQIPEKNGFEIFEKGFQQNNCSYFCNMFYGTQLITTFCHGCRAQFNQFQIFTGLILPLKVKENNFQNKRQKIYPYYRQQQIDLNDCLKYYQQQLNVGNVLYCKGCNHDTKTDIVRKIYKIPPILILNLKRFASNGLYYTKNNIKINIPSKIKLNDLKNKAIVDYQLYAVVNHIGDLSYGHYFAYCQEKSTKKWHEFNDTKVKPIQNVVANEAYILFYQRCL